MGSTKNQQATQLRNNNNNNNNNNMPKVTKNARFSCGHCNQSYPTQRGLSLHQYHERRLCGHYTNLLHPPHDSHHHDPERNSDSTAFDDQQSNPTEQQNNDVSNNDNNHFQQSLPTFLTTFFQQDQQQAINFSVEQRVHIKLLTILDKIEAPDYVFQSILQWATEAKCLNYSFSPRHTTRSAVIQELCQHVQMKSANPIVSQIQLKHVNNPLSIVSFDFKHQLCSLLNDPTLMTPDNLCINPAITLPNGQQDVSPWFMPYKTHNNMLNEEVLSGSWYQNTCQKYNQPDQFVCPLILYVDKTFIDPMRSTFNLEPLNFTLAIFKQKCRSQFKFWRTLGYIPEHPKIQDRRENNSSTTSQNYHIMVQHLLKDIHDLQTNVEKCKNFPLRIGNYYKYVTLCLPIAFIIADTQGADKLCGRYLCYTNAVKRIHRACTCGPEQAADTSQKCVWVTMEEMMKVIDSKDEVLMDRYSQQYLPNHAFNGIDFGSNSHGIYGATPYDILHGLKLGIIQHILKVLHDQDMNSASKHAVDIATTTLLPYFRQSATASYPRLHFPNGLSSLTNVSGEETFGVLFLTYIHLSTKSGSQAYSHRNDTLSVAKLIKYWKIFEFLLIFTQWI
jgi:hypothetical protein